MERSAAKRRRARGRGERSHGKAPAGASTPRRRRGRKPFGTAPGSAQAVALIVGRRTLGASFREIARELNAASIPAHSGPTWHPGSVRRVWLRFRPEQLGE